MGYGYGMMMPPMLHDLNSSEGSCEVLGYQKYDGCLQ